MKTLLRLSPFLFAARMFAAEPVAPPSNTLRIATCQAQSRAIDWRITRPAEVLAAAIGDEEIGVQALRVRAVENFVYLVVAYRNRGAMIISPHRKILLWGQSRAFFPIHFRTQSGEDIRTKETGRPKPRPISLVHFL